MRSAPQRDTVEFASGLLLGSMLGGALALLVAPDRSRSARFLRRLERPRRRAARRSRVARKAGGTAGRQSAAAAGAIASLLGELMVATHEELFRRKGANRPEALRRLMGSGSRRPRDRTRLERLRRSLRGTERS